MDNGTFDMSNVRSGAETSGSYSLSDGILRLEDAEGSFRTDDFPMTCRISLQENGFSLSDADGDCTFLDGMTFERVEEGASSP
jgi:hypothetical protein